MKKFSSIISKYYSRKSFNFFVNRMGQCGDTTAIKGFSTQFLKSVDTELEIIGIWSIFLKISFESASEIDSRTKFVLSNFLH